MASPNPKLSGLEEELSQKNAELARLKRELEIEAALDKVRSGAMNMRRSAELAEASSVLFHQIKELNIKVIRSGVGIFDEDNNAMELWLTTFSESEEVVRILDYVNLHIHPVFENIIPARNEKKPFAVTVLQGPLVKEYYTTMSTYISLPKQQTYNALEAFYSFFFQEGAINVIAANPLTEEECGIMSRFADAFGVIYTRFLDLQQAEARANQAVREASLDRVRAEITSMRSAEDLKRITPLIWRELKALGVPFFRCGLMIANEQEQIVYFYLSTPDDKPLAALHLGFDSVDVARNAMKHWREQTVYTEHWNREQFAAFAKSMLEQGQIKEARAYQGGAEPPESLTLQFMPFAQGMLYVGSAEPLPEDQIELVQTLAETFSTAYARYEDFTKLEAAKAQVDNTLKELRITQAQLVQSEKMASLGELTAGIAHEIQNPLNFVNNFSEVNSELITEMKEALARGNIDEAKAIADTIDENESKIVFHGKRADAIVKGMLQHSRSSSGVKEPTDINVLADEYLRLAYHGLRAKDKSFNSAMKTDFDPAINAVPVVPQDIGRVILNLITNAFYAVTEKKKLLPTGYEPTVTVTTKKQGDSVSVSVRDNGNGIPQKVLDKIFQPFFTTKPTGQGTGLGLSMSYDIVKAHGGELNVETREGEGSVFSVILPVD